MVALNQTRWTYHKHDDSRDHSSLLMDGQQESGSNEASPLLSSPDDEQAGLEEPAFAGLDDVDDVTETSMSTGRIILLCLGMVGLQLAWAAELSNGSPFLLSLGMSKSLLAIVWIAGPLAGVLVQPVVGIWSDSCQISWGRRRPFLIAGSISTAISLMCLSWTQDIVRGMAILFGGHPESQATIAGAQAFAIFWIYVLDFAVNVLQAALRAFIVDVAPTHQQDQANAWASRLMGIANILGYIMGYAHLPKLFPWLGNTQLKVLCAIGSTALIVTVAISSAATPEKNPQMFWPSTGSTLHNIIGFLKTSFTAFSRLPIQTQRVCRAQFFNWIGWFPFLFYISTYIGQLYVNPILLQHPNATKAEIDEAWDAGTRLGALALLTFAITSFAGNLLLPFIIQPLASSDLVAPKGRQPLSWLQIPGLTIRRAWMLSHLFFAVCMWSTLFIRTPSAGAIMSGCVGLSWSMTNWAPFTIIAADISQRDLDKRRKGQADHQQRLLQNSVTGELAVPSEGDVDQAGVVLGLHNVAVSAPQILATLIASTIFHFTQKDRNVPNDDSVAQVLRFGGIAALIALWATSRIA